MNTNQFVVKGDVRVPKLEMLISLKLASGEWGKRLRDFADVIELIKANKLAKRFASKLPADLRPKFVELLETSRRERTIE